MGTPLVRPGLQTGAEPVSIRPARPYPQPPPKFDYQEALSRMETTLKDTTENLAALKKPEAPGRTPRVSADGRCGIRPHEFRGQESAE